MQKYGLGCVAAIVIVLLLAAFSGCSTYNTLVGLSQGVDSSWAQVQNVYQRRADLIPNLVSTVTGAANFEKSTLTEIATARASVGQLKIDPNTAPSDPETIAKFQAAQNQLGTALSRLLVVSERYPELKANSGFRDLQAQLEGTENRIAVERQKFNEVTQAYNTKVKTAPTTFYAAFLGFTAKPYFQATAGSDTPPKVNFDFGKATPAPAP